MRGSLIAAAGLLLLLGGHPGAAEEAEPPTAASQEEADAGAGEATQEAAAPAPKPEDPVVAGIKRLLAGDTRGLIPPGIALDRSALRKFYEARDFKPFWIADDGVRAAAGPLIEAIKQVEEEGLDPAKYAAATIEEAVTTEGPRDALTTAVLDVLLSQSLGRYALEVQQGRVDPAMVYTEEDLEPKRRYDFVAETLEEAAAAQDLTAHIESLNDLNPIYDRLRTALADYRSRASSPPVVTIPEGRTVTKGERDPRIPDLRRRLGLEVPAEDADLLDEKVEQALRDFQKENGLGVDGVLGPNTRAVLNRTDDDKVRLIVANMERARWLPREFGARYLLVDTAAFELELGADGKPVRRMKVITGTEYNQTPMFADRLEYVEINPYWNVPNSIIQNEIAPAVQQDPSYLERNKMEVLSTHGARLSPGHVSWSAAAGGNVNFRVRQRPGPENALGQIKFMFPNKFAIYLHDTPAKELFDENRRTDSHGCIRVEDPMAVADFVLQGTEGWDAGRVEEVIGTGENRRVDVGVKMPVYITYFTAWPVEDGTVEFRPDVYERDPELLTQLFGEGAVAEADGEAEAQQADGSGDSSDEEEAE